MNVSLLLAVSISGGRAETAIQELQCGNCVCGEERQLLTLIKAGDVELGHVAGQVLLALLGIALLLHL